MFTHSEVDSDATLPVRAMHVVPDSGVVVRVLGEVDVAGRGGTLAAGGGRPGALLALLAIHAGECMPVDRIIDELWTTQAAGPAVKRVQVNVLRLRRALARVAPDVDPAAVIRTRACGYALEVDPDAIDAVRFARLAARGRRELDRGAPDLAAATLRSALGLWRADPYADYAYEPFAAAEIRRLRDLRSYGLETWAEAQLALGAHMAMVSSLGWFVARDPLRERLQELLMLALYRCGRQADALAAYRTAHDVLVDTLGIEPGPQLRDLQRAILDQSPWLLDAGATRGPRTSAGHAA